MEDKWDNHWILPSLSANSAFDQLPYSFTNQSMSRLAMLGGGGNWGSPSGANQPASAISASSSTKSPPAYSAVKPSINELGKGQGWLAT